MCKYFLSVVSLMVVSGAALADNASPRNVVSPMISLPTWTGGYAGLNAGYGFGTNNSVQTYAYDGLNFLGERPTYKSSVYLPFGIGASQGGPLNSTQGGFIGGGQVGYNYQMRPDVVVSVETDIQGSVISGGANGGGISGPYSTQASANIGPKGVFTTSAYGGSSVDAGIDWIGTVRGRIGYLWNPTMLLYGTGGFTYAGAYASANNYAVSSQKEQRGPLSQSYTRIFMGGVNQNQILTGWNAGGGFEWMFAKDWSAKAEAIYWNVGNMNLQSTLVSAAPSANPRCPLSHCQNAFASTNNVVNYQGIIARLGLNYHFHW